MSSKRVWLGGLALIACAALVVSGAASLVAAQALPSPAPTPQGLAAGDTVQPFDAEGVDGTSRHVTFGGSDTVLLFFLSSCPTCHRMIPVWNTAYERRPKNLEVVGVMLDQEAPGFFMATPISFPVVRAAARTPAERKVFTDRFKIHKVPVMLRVGRGGKVEDVAFGLVDPIRVGELFRP